MESLVPAAWLAGVFIFIWLFVWIAVRLIRWAKSGSTGTALLGWGMGLPSAGINPLPPPQEHIQEVTLDIQGRKNSDASDPDDQRRPIDLK